METTLQTRFDFVLPLGYQDSNGVIHREGTMRLANAADEIEPQRDPNVQNNPSYLSIILLSRVVVKLGTLQMITPPVIKGLFLQDFEFLIAMYNRINQTGTNRIKAKCPHCSQNIEIEAQSLGE